MENNNGKKKVEIKFTSKEFQDTINGLKEKKIKYRIYGKMNQNGKAEYRAVYYE